MIVHLLMDSAFVKKVWKKFAMVVLLEICPEQLRNGAPYDLCAFQGHTLRQTSNAIGRLSTWWKAPSAPPEMCKEMSASKWYWLEHSKVQGYTLRKIQCTHCNGLVGRPQSRTTPLLDYEGLSCVPDAAGHLNSFSYSHTNLPVLSFIHCQS